MSFLIQNAWTRRELLGLGGQGDVRVHVLIEKERISQILESENATHITAAQTIDALGLFLAPGLFDPQVHFREPGMEYKEDTLSGSRAANRGGFTAVVSMPNTSPVADTPEVVRTMVERAAQVGLCDVYPTGALSIGLKGQQLSDFAQLKAAGAVAITDDGKGVQDDGLFMSAMRLARQTGLAILDHSEDERLSAGGAIHAGEVSRRFGVAGIGAMSEARHVERGCQYSRQTGAHFHVLHVSTAASIEAVRRAKAEGLNVTVEVSPHHLVLCDEDIATRDDQTLDANWKMNPPLRSRQDMLACQEALLDGTIDAIATDHAPHAPHEKALPIEQAPFGIIGLETAFPLIYTNFVKTGRLPLHRCIDLMSLQGRQLFGLPGGRIQVGEFADLCLMDLETPVQITPEFFASKSSNSPFIGQTLYGVTRMTFYRGQQVYPIVG